MSVCCVILIGWTSDADAQTVEQDDNTATQVPQPYPTRPASAAAYRHQSRYLTMRDGVNLAITIYIPEGLASDTRVPTILHQTRYWRAIQYRWPLSMFQDDEPRGIMAQYARRFLANGYAWVDVDVRGSGASFGHRPYAYSPEEIRDGEEIVDWIIQQPWSNGQVGALGISYAGTTAELLLVNRHPAVKAVAPLFSGFDLFPEVAFPGGVHLEWFTKTWTAINHALDHNRLPFPTWMSRLFVRGVMPVDEDNSGVLLQKAIAEHQSNWSPHREALGLTFRDDPPPSRAVASIDKLSTKTYAPNIAASGAAIYSYSGWFDGGYQFAAIARHRRHTHPRNKLLIGPWDHGGKRRISPFSVGQATFDHQGELIKFFDHHLKDRDTPVTRDAPVHYYTMGAERWNASAQWPPEADRTRWYLRENRTLSSTPPGSETPPDIYRATHDIGTGTQSRWNALVGIPLTEPYHDRRHPPSQLLTYVTPPLEDDWEVTGHPVVTLHLSADTPDLTIFAYLDDIPPDGDATYVTEGLLRALHRHEAAPPAWYPPDIPYHTFRRRDAMPLVPEQVATLSFDLLPTSYVFKKHHRVRLAIAGADRDHFVPLQGKPPTITLHHDARRASHLILPIVHD